MSARQIAEAFKKLNPDYPGSLESLETYYGNLLLAQHQPPEHLRDLFAMSPRASRAEMVSTFSQIIQHRNQHVS